MIPESWDPVQHPAPCSAGSLLIPTLNPCCLITKGVIWITSLLGIHYTLAHELVHYQVRVPNLNLNRLLWLFPIKDNRKVPFRIQRVFYSGRPPFETFTCDVDIRVSLAYNILFLKTSGRKHSNPCDHLGPGATTTAKTTRVLRLVQQDRGEIRRLVTEQSQEEVSILTRVESCWNDEVSARGEGFPEEDMPGPYVVTGATI